MADKNLTLRFYKHSNDEEEIGWQHCIDNGMAGSNLRQLFDLLNNQGLYQRACLHEIEGGGPGDLYVLHRRFFRFEDNAGSFMRAPRTLGPVANVLDVTMNSEAGWAQYLSFVLRGPYKEEVAQRLTGLGFFSQHSSLAKEDKAPLFFSYPNRLWLDDIADVVEFPSLVPSK